jgi:hypothetical protein
LLAIKLATKQATKLHDRPRKTIINYQRMNTSFFSVVIEPLDNNVEFSNDAIFTGRAKLTLKSNKIIMIISVCITIECKLSEEKVEKVTRKLQGNLSTL